jgi:hypothetical protein
MRELPTFPSNNSDGKCAPLGSCIFPALRPLAVGRHNSFGIDRRPCSLRSRSTCRPRGRCVSGCVSARHRDPPSASKSDPIGSMSSSFLSKVYALITGVPFGRRFTAGGLLESLRAAGIDARLGWNGDVDSDALVWPRRISGIWKSSVGG